MCQTTEKTRSAAFGILSRPQGGTINVLPANTPFSIVAVPVIATLAATRSPFLSFFNSPRTFPVLPPCPTLSLPQRPASRPPKFPAPNTQSPTSWPLPRLAPPALSPPPQQPPSSPLQLHPPLSARSSAASVAPSHVASASSHAASVTSSATSRPSSDTSSTTSRASRVASSATSRATSAAGGAIGTGAVASRTNSSVTQFTGPAVSLTTESYDVL
ncbi:uncharacterized protein M421DRAFT_91002 [Didymella exigua CBS 183.55]|uniref:Uncharacterized protein n=1 Tax=Didymella exigua CBS 183.55 TaxID=1150837 RepID=A0A6A5RRR8_9PLEO|nr:uncharacterized protein M421DRAFT_91002 [Didymella exigua CBS 183.55]KAF1930472.1 hypothetical protein M421DRAFT_91002 [Didymella exigua CBS 183.55]